MNTDGLVEMLKEICSDEPILVAQAYRFFENEMTLPEFKALLLQTWRTGKASLSRCDMPELFRTGDVDESLIRHGVGEFHMVQAKAWK